MGTMNGSLISDFSERVLRSVLEHERKFPETAGFAAAIFNACKATTSISPEYSFTFHLNPNPKEMGSDPKTFFLGILGETEGWLGFVVHSVAFRIEQFLDDIVTGLNDARPYRCVSAARGLIELTAFVHHHAKILIDATTKVSSADTDDPAASVGEIVKTWKAALHFAQVTRFNWITMMQGDGGKCFTEWGKVEERIKATQILTLIDKLPADEHWTPRFFYEMLCDYVHPNVGAHTLVVNVAEPVSGRRMRWKLSREPNSDEALTVLVYVAAIPIRQSIRILLKDLSSLQNAHGYFNEWKRLIEAKS